MQFRALLAAGVAAIAVGSAAAPASAGIVTSAPAGSTFVAFPVMNYFGPGPQTFGPGITWSSTNAANQGGSVFGYNAGYGFGSNGSSFADLTGVNDNFAFYGVSDTMTFSFASPVSQVGAIINWYPDAGDTVHIDWYDTSNNLLADLVLNNAGGNVVAPNSYYGFLSSSANIGSFTLTDGYVAAIGGLSLNGGVPEPATWAMMLIGLGGLGAMMRSRRRPVGAGA
jgi:hypothetical protein